MPKPRPNYCTLPEPMKPNEADLYNKLRGMHCDRKLRAHDCIGQITIDQKGMTLNCPRCGDYRTVYR